MERLFNLDPQLLHDAVLLAIAVFVMFTFLSYLLFNPARDFLKKREERIKGKCRCFTERRKGLYRAGGNGFLGCNLCR